MKTARETTRDCGSPGNIRDTSGIGMVVMLAAVLICLALPHSALADRDWQKGHPQKRWQGQAQRFVLDFNDSRVLAHRGQPAVLYLKKELMRQYPGVDVSALHLRNVVLVAKTRAGLGTVQLRVGPEVSSMHQVAGNPVDFHSRNRHSFDRIRIHNPYGPSWGPWQLHLRGNFTLRKVILEVEERQRHHYGWEDSGGGFHVYIR